MSTRHGAVTLRCAVGALVLASGLAVTASGAINVTFEFIAGTGDPVPGRELLNVVFNGRAFQQFSYTDGVLSRPSINAGGEVVFRGVSSHPTNFNTNSAVGLYAKSPGFPLIVLADTTTDGGGNPTFAVPGQSAATQFTNFKPPFINDRGDVLFYATYGSATGSGSGFYAMTSTGGPIVKIVDSTDTVPGFPGTTFDGFAFGGTFQRFTLGSLNDVGQIVFMGVFNAPDDIYQDVGLYGTTVGGGLLVRLADATASMTMVDLDPSITIHGLQQDRNAALNNAGMVVFGADIGATPFVAQRAILAVPVDGSAGIRTLAQRYQPVLLSDGVSHTLYANFNGHDINDAGQFMFQHAFSPGAGSINALITGDVNVPGSPLSVVVDNAGGFAVPQRLGSNFAGIRMTTLNDSGQLGFDALSDVPANGSGVYSTDLTGSQVGFVADSSTAPSGRPALVFNSFGSFDQPNDGESVVINNSGNMALTAIAINEAATDITFGLYFFDSCTGNLERLVDETTSSPLTPVGLGDVFATSACGGNPCQRFFMMWDGSNTRAGHYRSINDNNDVAFVTAFSTFNVGVYVAHVQTAGGGGQVSLTCPPDLVATTALECGGDTSPVTAGSATAVDGCTGVAIATTFTDVSVAACSGTETITRTWTAGTASCVQLITTVDSVAPALIAPANVTVGCAASIDPTNTGQATAGDACDVAPGLTYTDLASPGICAQAHVITRTWTATDACGNAISLDQTINVTDTTAPVLTVPADVQIACDASTAASNTGHATAADDCDPAPTVTSSDAIAPGSCPQNSVVTRTWTATDACGNAVSANQLITLVDGAAPTLVAPAAAIVECDADSSPTGTGVATATDNCDGAPLVTSSDVAAAGVCPQASQITRTWSATDACSNSSAAAQSVSVVDTTAPVITLNGPAAIVLAGCIGQAYVELGASASDNCDSSAIPVLIGGSVVDTAVLGIYVVTYNAQDACANAATQVARTVDVLDTTAPAFTSLPADLTVECEGTAGVPLTNANIVAFLNTAAAADACDPIVGITNNAPATFPFGDTTVTWTATDAAGNAFTATRIVHVVDTAPPVVSCPAGTTTPADANCLATVPDVTGGVLASDTCADSLALTITQVPLAGTPLTRGTHVIVVTAADPNGNSAQCTTTLTVADVSAPSLTVPLDLSVACDAPSAPSATGQATASDNCDPAPSVTFSDSVTAGTCPDLTVIARQWTASDASGNTSIGGQTITVQDTTGPSITCPPDTATSGGFGGTVVTFAPSASDACVPNPSVSAAPPSGSFFPTGVTPVSATASDTCGNASLACSFNVLVSCFGVNRAKIGTKDIACRGIEEIEFTSMNGTEELISLFKAEQHSGGAEEDTLPVSIIVDDGVNGPVTVDTSCTQAVFVGDVFGPYTVTDIEKDFDNHVDNHGNKVELRGSFVPAVPYDLATDDFVISIDDGQGNVAVFTIPAGSFQIHGSPSKGKFKFEGTIGVAQVEAKLEDCSYKFEMENATNTGQLLGNTMTGRRAGGLNVAEQTLVMENKGNHLKFKGQPKVNCCPDCIGIASMQVTSDQGVLVFGPAVGATELPANTVVDDGVNGAVTIHTSCSQPLVVGDQFGAYTVSEVIEIFE